jgi:hypothetical protein
LGLAQPRHLRGSFSPRTWLYRIATNACLDALDRRPRHLLPQDLLPPADPHRIRADRPAMWRGFSRTQTRPLEDMPTSEDLPEAAVARIAASSYDSRAARGPLTPGWRSASGSLGMTTVTAGTGGGTRGCHPGQAPRCGRRTGSSQARGTRTARPWPAASRSPSSGHQTR